MAILKDLKITNFRCFDKIEIQGLSKLNIFVGQNNSGKTSALEAIFLLIGMSNSDLPCVINSLRGLNEHTSQIKYLFHDFSYEILPVLSGKFSDDTKRELEIKPILKYRDVFGIASSQSPPYIRGIESDFAHIEQHNTRQSYKSSFDFESKQRTVSTNYREPFNICFMTPRISDRSSNSSLSEILKRKEGDEIVQILRETFDSNISNIHSMPDGIYIDMKNMNEYVPIKIMGDGFRRFLDILTVIFENSNPFVLIDEIENGLHYTAYKGLWKALLAFARQHEIQLLVSTHSIETLECLTSILDEETYEDMRDYTKVIALAKTKEEKFKAYNYSYEEFKTAINNDFELRR